ncbi:MAG: hypothetical protein LUE92_00635 [Clostridiales bacterium]|nr:hypothetical protein [Clostridiales bacterium]
MDYNKGTITRRMDSVLNGLEDEFNSLYTKIDFYNKIDEVKKAEKKSDLPTKKSQLFAMLDACGVSYKREGDDVYYRNLVEKSDIPNNWKELEEKMLLALYDRYQEYPTPEDYMKRIVDRLCSEEDGWNNDTLRLRILKQFVKYGNYLKDAGIEGRKTVHKYAKEKSGNKNLKDETVPDYLDDEVFSQFDQTDDENQKKPKGKYGLLKVADDLAAGKFRSGGSTRKNLYLFAMVYSMTYYSGETDDGRMKDVRTDIETNLFRDYYACNFMRYISDTYRENRSAYEDPSGQGINYKNYAEMVYLYYISKDCSPQDKIRLSSEMINRLKGSQPGEKVIDKETDGRTGMYKNMFTEDILRLDKEEFEAFIRDNYDTSDNKSSALQLETEQNTAFRVYQDILDDIACYGEDFAESSDPKDSLTSCNYGLWFTDVKAFGDERVKSICAKHPHVDYDRFNEFISLLNGINDYMGYTVDGGLNKSKSKIKALDISSAKNVSRASIIVAYYYYYNRFFGFGSVSTINKKKSFEEMFHSFKRNIDEKLDASYYQRLSGKNIFDIAVVFSSYYFLNS